jgi:hypothetical protein
MRINLDTGKVKQVESARDKLLREGRIEARREMVARIYASARAERKAQEVATSLEA